MQREGKVLTLCYLSGRQTWHELLEIIKLYYATRKFIYNRK